MFLLLCSVLMLVYCPSSYFFFLLDRSCESLERTRVNKDPPPTPRTVFVRHRTLQKMSFRNYVCGKARQSYLHSCQSESRAFGPSFLFYFYCGLEDHYRGTTYLYSFLVPIVTIHNCFAQNDCPLVCRSLALIRASVYCFSWDLDR